MDTLNIMNIMEYIIKDNDDHMTIRVFYFEISQNHSNLMGFI